MTPIIGNPTILIVDDTPGNLSLVVSLFEDRGYRVAIAQDGEEGVQRAQLLQPDLILLDVMMPGKDGFDACRQLKESPETQDIPVIFMTALASTEHKIKGFKAGAVDYVTKPLQIDEVIARVDTHLKLHAAQKCLAEQNEQLDKHREELEQRVAERTAELAAREREFRTLAENQPDNLARYDKQCRIVYLNPQLESFLGVKAKNRLGKTPTESSPGPLYIEYQARIAETIATGLPGEMELVLPDMGEGVRYHHIRFVAERDGSGEIVGALTIGRDITERKKTERELQLLNRAVNASTEAVFLMDEQGRFVYVNEQACRSLGYSREELLTLTPADIDPDITAEMLQGMMAAEMASGQSYPPFETRHRARDGRIFPVEIVPSPITLEGERYYLSMTRDISARKEAERILHEQQQAIRAVVENSPDAISRYDRELRRTYINPATQKLYGIPSGEIIGKKVEELPPALDDFGPILMTVFERKEELRIESVFYQANGEKGWADVRIVPEFETEGHVATVLVIGRDITERKRAEAALHESEQRYREIFENVTDSLYLVEVTPEGLFRSLAFNAAFEKSTGIPREALIGRVTGGMVNDAKVEFALQDESTRAIIEKYRHCVNAGKVIEEDSILDMPRGRRHYHSTLVPLRNESGRIHRILGIAHDVTEIKRAEEALRGSEQRYREIFDNAIEGIYLLEVTEDGRFRNVDINPALAASVGIPREAMIGKFVEETVPEEAGRQIVEKYRRCVAAGKTIIEEIELDLPSGKRHYLSAITPIYFEGRIHRLIGISRDVTELKQVERELKESRNQLRGLTAQREKTREQERKYIAREVHDELGQILTGLKLNISVLDHKFAADSAPLHAHVQETLMLTDKALGVARNVASALRPAALDMGIVSALEWLTGRFAANTGIECDVHIEDDDLQLQENHAIALFRIVQESLTNVARYAKADRVVVDLHKDADDYILKVRDNGAGFDTAKIKSNSYGLLGMRERALLLDGTVTINSKPGSGTEIVVRVPMQSIPEES
jgi:PAS domain S-box-containing protein